MSDAHLIACDLGAESGRVILGTLHNGRISLEEIHRFSTGGSRVGNTLRWDIVRIFDELKAGLRKIAARDVTPASMSVDSWGVDYVYFRRNEPALSTPYHYRDTRTEKAFEAALKKAGAETIFRETGIQFLPFNTLYQLLADLQDNPGLINLADRFLNIADYLHYLFCGRDRAEESIASTTQVYDPRKRDWSDDLIHLFGIPHRVFPEIVPPGTVLGPLLPALQEETGLGPIEVIATCSHDTGAAVAAVPAEPGDDWAYLSSGTWSLIGVELSSPRIDEFVRKHNFTNEAGYGGTTRFLKNIVGLWILQECRRQWQREGIDHTYAELNQMAEEAEPLQSLINPNAARFMKPGDMPEKIRRYCEETAQPVPETPGEFVRTILESLALLYRQTLGVIHELTGRTVRKLHIVGGGSQSKLLNQFAANALDINVLAGPVEATAIGNLLVQAIALGKLDSLTALREAVRKSFPVDTYHPLASVAWEHAYERFRKLDLET